MKNNFGSQELPIITNEAGSITSKGSEVDSPQASTEAAVGEVLHYHANTQSYKTWSQAYKSWLFGNTPHSSGEPLHLEFTEAEGITPEMLENEALSKQQQLEVFFEYVKEHKLEIPDELDTKYRNLTEKVTAISRTVRKMEGKTVEETVEEVNRLKGLFDGYISLVTDIDSIIDTTYTNTLEEEQVAARAEIKKSAEVTLSQSERITQNIIKGAERMLSTLNKKYIETVRNDSEEKAVTLVALRDELLLRLHELQRSIEQSGKIDEQTLSVYRHNTYKAGLAIQHFLKPVPQARSEMETEGEYTSIESNNNMKEGIPTSNNGNSRRLEEVDSDLTYIYTNYAERPSEKDAEEQQAAIEPGGEESVEHVTEESVTASQANENAGNYPSPARRQEIVDAEFTEDDPTPGQYPPPALGIEVVEGELIDEDNPTPGQYPLPVPFKEIVEPSAQNLIETDKVAPKTPEQEEYQTLRGEWLAAKKAHEAAHAAYTEQVKEHYDSLQDRNIILKSWDKIRATIGIKPKLPPEIEAQRSEMFTATGKYNELADKMRQMRSVGKPGKEDYLSTPSLNDPAIQERIAKGEISQDEIRRMKVQDRYFKLLSRSTMMNTFNAQLEAQNKATENLAIKANGKLLKYRKPLMWLGAGTIGAATGGLAAGGIAVARMVAGGAAASAMAGLLSPKLDGYVENVSRMSDEEFKGVITDYDTRLRSKALTGEEREEIYNELQTILGKVDKAKRDRVLALMGLAAVTGFAFGAGVGQVMDMDMFNTDAVTGVAVPAEGGEGLVDAGAKPEINLDGILADADLVPSPVGGESLEQVLSGYAAQPGDTMWDILEGQTEAGKLPFLEQVDPDKLQATLKAVELHLDSNPDLATEIGFRGDPDLLMVGDQIDLAKLNALALEMAEQKGYLVVDGAGLPEGVTLEVEQPTFEVADVSEVEGAPLPAGVEFTVEAPTFEIAETPDTPSTPPETGVVTNPSTQTVTPFELDVKALSNETTRVLTEQVSQYPGGPVAFEQNFTNQFVYAVEGKPASGIFSFLSETPPSVGALSILEHVDKMTLSKLVLMSEVERLSELDKLGLTEPQYDAWKTYIDYAVSKEDFPPNATFGEILRTKYIDGSLSPDKQITI